MDVSIRLHPRIMVQKGPFRADSVFDSAVY